MDTKIFPSKTLQNGNIVAFVMVFAVNLGWNGFGIAEPTWSAIMMLIAVGVAGVLLFNRRNAAYAGGLIWALFGIRAAYSSVAIVANTAVFAAVLILILAAIGYWRTRNVRIDTNLHAQVV